MTDEQRSPDPEQDKETRAEKRERSAWKQVGTYSELGFLLPACTFVGWAIGAGFDKWRGTHWATLTGVLVGVGVGFFQMIRMALRASK
jgi:F0F1-type ATP synthase assembly protein I